MLTKDEARARVAANLKRARGETSMRAVAARMHELDSTVASETWRSHLMEWESQRRWPNSWHLLIFAAATDVSVGMLLVPLADDGMAADLEMLLQTASDLATLATAVARAHNEIKQQLAVAQGGR